MFATVLYRMAGSPSVDGLSVSFKDVKEGTWSYSAIVWAYSEGITKGVGGDMFAPEQSITREELVEIGQAYANAPEDFEYHPRVAPVAKKRAEAAQQ